ncbi:NS1 [Eubenangee virus]|uniref:Non-structural protein NS1 n=1 Tax=Eubenangee virus TaxID=40056 RepID=H9ZXR6_9REOV|nr:NS1 [Eubenangee virus]AFH41513.1 NS1 [Eubenangee virus]
MDIFLVNFRVEGEDAFAVRLFGSVSRFWNCSHRQRNCLVGTSCCRQNFEELVDRANREDDHELAGQLVRNAIQCVLDREKLWVHCVRAFSELAVDGLDIQLDVYFTQLKRICAETGVDHHMRSLKTERRANRVKIDDTVSFLPYFYPPMINDGIVRSVAFGRYGGCGIWYYEREEGIRYADFRVREVRAQILRCERAILRELPLCPYTGKRCNIYRVVFFPIRMRDFLNEEGERDHIMRRVESDGWMIEHLGGPHERDFITQRLGTYPRGPEALSQIMMLKREVGGREMNLVEMRVTRDGGETWASWGFPGYMIRLWNCGRIDINLVDQFILSKQSCQICYMSEERRDRQVLLFDYRLAHMMGTPLVRYGTDVIHDHGGLDVRKVVLTRNQMLVRLCDHWIIMTPDTGMEAILTAAGTMHKIARGRGQWNTTDWMQTMGLLCRLIIRWEFDRRQWGMVLKLFCFACFGYVERTNGARPDWNDLQIFYRFLLEEVNINIAELEEAVFVMFRLAVLAMSHLNLKETVDIEEDLAINPEEREETHAAIIGFEEMLGNDD